MEGFDRTKNVTLVGTVKQFKWANPHSWIELEVPNAKGGVDSWNIEMTAPFVSDPRRLEIEFVESGR